MRRPILPRLLAMLTAVLVHRCAATWSSPKQRNKALTHQQRIKALTLAHAQTIHYTSNTSRSTGHTRAGACERAGDITRVDAT